MMVSKLKYLDIFATKQKELPVVVSVLCVFVTTAF